MKLLLTSFGTTGLSDIAIPYNPVFYRMPPVRMVGKSKGVFVPDYSALLVCDKLVLDKSSFDVLCTNSHYSYRLIAETLNTLYREGFIELVNFDEILKSNAETLKQMLDYDLQIPDRWIKPLEESLLIWNDFSEDLPEIIQGKKEHILSEQYLHFAGHGLCHPAVPLESGLLWASDNNITQTDSASSLLHESVGTSKERQEFQRNDAIRKALSINLAYINANLVISSELETGLYDWRDFLPLYRQKFLSVGRKRIDGISHVEQLQRLFSVAFPEFTITDTATLMKVLKDKRIEELRFLVQNAVSGKVTFDEIFAKRVLRDVLNNERTLSKYRNLISYLTTMPLSLGNFLTESGSGIQEIETRVIKDALDKQKQYSWFYLLDESIGEASASENETMNFPGLSYEQDLLVQSGRGEQFHGVTSDFVLSRRAGVISILFLAADPMDASRLRLGEELREIQEKLQLAKLREQFELHQRTSVRPTDISQALLDVQPQIVHFSGHGTSTGALCFENQVGQVHLVQPDALAALFEQFTHQVICILLNACYSENQARAISEHIQYVIGMNQEFGDKAAIAFAIGFYQALGAGRTVEEAYKLGVVQIRLQDIPEHLTPVLIKDGQLQS